MVADFFTSLLVRMCFSPLSAVDTLCGDLFYWPQDVLDRTAKLGFK